MPGLSEEQCQAFLKQALEDERLSELWEGIRNSNPSSAPRGCGPSLSMLCKTCGRKGPEGGARAFVEAPPVGLVLCANRLSGLDDVKAALRHELVHAYDMCAAEKDLTQCTELAYSEVRAAREAECHTYQKYGHWFGLTRILRDSCVRENATRATQSLFAGEEGARCVNSEFARAISSVLTSGVPLSTPPKRSSASANKVREDPYEKLARISTKDALGSESNTVQIGSVGAGTGEGSNGSSSSGDLQERSNGSSRD